MTPLEVLIRNNKTKRPRIAIIGDAMRDEFVSGTIEYSSQEAHVPIFRQQSATILPGGAANLARQFRHWNADITLFALIDQPTEAILGCHDISTARCVRLVSGTNPLKRRLYADDHPVVREDIEQPNDGERELPTLREKLLNQVRYFLPIRPDAVVISDYAKGIFDETMLRQVLDICREPKIPVIVDPHLSRGPAAYAGCSIFKPNAAYAHRYGLVRICDAIGANGGNVILTKGHEPPEGVYQGKHFKCATQPAVAARSVVGAGDCFACHLTLATVHDLTIAEAAEIADAAGRIYVQRTRNEPVMPCEVLRHIDPIAGKAIGPEELAEFLGHRHQGDKVVFTNGCFDLFHAGHLHTLRWARQQGSLLVVGINDDASVTRLKGAGRPAVDLADRIRVLAGLACVDWVIPFAEDTPEKLIRTLRPTTLVKGPDYDGRRIAGDELVTDVCFAPASGIAYHSSDLLTRGRR